MTLSGEDAAERARAARARADELEARLHRLQAGEPVTTDDVDHAEQAAVRQRARSSDAHRHAAQAHEEAARHHRQASDVLEAAGHPERAAAHRQKAAVDDAAAQTDQDLAAADADVDVDAMEDSGTEASGPGVGDDAAGSDRRERPGPAGRA